MKYSFDRVGTYKSMDVYRSIISRADPITTDEHFAGLKALFDRRLGEQWVWVVDCRDMGVSHFMNFFLLQELYTMIQRDQKDSVQHIWVLNINWWVSSMLAMFKTTKVQILTDGPLELLELGCSNTLIDKLTLDPLPDSD
jgi:hypothetical protein